jgi:malonyl-CoA O-methyltransferase
MSLTELDRDWLIRSFDRAAAAYDGHAVLQKEVESRLLERLVFARNLPQNVLDLGCGTGRASVALQAHFPSARVIGLDWSRGMLGALSARRRSTPAPLSVCADFENLPLPDASIDLVFSSLALQWSNQPAAAFGEIRRVLRPGGMLWLTRGRTLMNFPICTMLVMHWLHPVLPSRWWMLSSSR